MSEVPQKRCTGPCGRTLDATTEYFHPGRRKCKECYKEQNRQKYANPDVRQHKQKYNQQRYANPEIRERHLEYKKQRNAQPEIRERRQKYDKLRYANPEIRERHLERQKQYDANPDVQQRRREYYKQNIKDKREYDKRRYANKKSEGEKDKIKNDTPHDVYRLRDPRDKAVFYVGISKNVQKRYKKHLACAGLNFKLNLRIQEILQCGLIPELELIERAIHGFDQAREREKFWINHHAQLGDQLTNIAEMYEAE